MFMIFPWWNFWEACGSVLRSLSVWCIASVSRTRLALFMWEGLYVYINPYLLLRLWYLLGRQKLVRLDSEQVEELAVHSNTIRKISENNCFHKYGFKSLCLSRELLNCLEASAVVMMMELATGWRHRVLTSPWDMGHLLVFCLQASHSWLPFWVTLRRWELLLLM